MYKFSPEASQTSHLSLPSSRCQLSMCTHVFRTQQLCGQLYIKACLCRQRRVVISWSLHVGSISLLHAAHGLGCNCVRCRASSMMFSASEETDSASEVCAPRHRCFPGGCKLPLLLLLLLLLLCQFLQGLWMQNLRAQRSTSVAAAAVRASGCSKLQISLNNGPRATAADA
jgi:hypothetical protein